MKSPLGILTPVYGVRVVQVAACPNNGDGGDPEPLVKKKELSMGSVLLHAANRTSSSIVGYSAPTARCICLAIWSLRARFTSGWLA
jgi:hypothetical protein